VNRYGADAARLHPSGVLEQPVVLTPDNKIRWALVYVKTGLGNQPFDPPPTDETLTFEDCLLAPPTLGIMTHQKLIVRNQDDFNHTFQVAAASNRAALSMLPARTSIQHYFTLSEQSILVHCPIHPWEKTRVFAFSHPFFCVTDETGRYEIRNLPPGRYQLAAWQDACAPQEKEGDLKSEEPLTLDFELEARPR
jgi:hypothetical protein